MDEQKEYNYICTLSEEGKKIAKDEIREDDLIREQSLEQFRNWLSKHSSIKSCLMDAKFLLRFLRTKKYSLPMAQKMLEKYLLARETYPHWFANLSVDDPGVQGLINDGYVVPLIHRDNYGRLIVFFNIGRVDPYKYTYVDLVRTHSIIFEALMDDEENQVRGYTYIINETGISMAHISLWSLLDIRKVMNAFQNGMPMRHKQVYLTNVPVLAGKTIEVALSCISEKLRSRVKICKSLEDVKECINFKNMPIEYGGEIPLQDMIDALKKTIEKKRDRIDSLNTMNMQVSTEYSSYVDEFDGILGSFRKLEVD